MLYTRFDNNSGRGGAPLQAIMAERKLSFQEAIKVGRDLAGMCSMETQVIEKRREAISHEVEQKNKISSAQSIWQGGLPIKDSLAERYLQEHRGIEPSETLEARFWPAGAAWKGLNEEGQLHEKTNKIPAIIFAAKNAKGILTGVQRIYLNDKTAKKNTFLQTAKLSQWVIQGSCGLIQKGMRGANVYLAEGPETAASIAMADRKATVLVSFGVSNMANLTDIIKSYKPKEVIIAADNDGKEAKTDNVIQKTLEIFKQSEISARAIAPIALKGIEKTDWNDVLLKQGVGEIKKQFLDIHHEMKHYPGIVNTNDLASIKDLNVKQNNITLDNLWSFQKNNFEKNHPQLEI